MWKRAANIYIGVCVILGGIFAFGVGMIFWHSYTNERNPVFQTTMTDVECCDDFNAYFTQKFNALGVKKVHCFIFQGHTHRPYYWICLVGKCPESADLPKTYKSHSFDGNISVFTALKLAGADPDDSETFKEIDTWFYLYKNWVVFKMDGKHTPFLFEDADKQAYLEKHIRKRSENR